MPARETPALVQLARQCRVTLALLPFVAGLPWFDEEVIARTFGQSMLILNWIPEAPSLPERAVPQLFKTSQRQTPRTKEEQRAYWREAKREERRLRRESKTKPGRIPRNA